MKKTSKIIKTALWGGISIALIAAFIVGVNIANSYETALTGFFGTYGSNGLSNEGTLFKPTYDTEEKVNEASEATASKIIGEGTVLLENNNNVLPLAKKSNVSVFGITSAIWKSEEKITGKSNTALTTALKEAGLNINDTLRSFYKSNSHKKWGQGSAYGAGTERTDWTIDETPYSEYTDAVKNSYDNFNDAAIVVLSRGGCEGADLPRHMDAQNGNYSDSYLSLSQNEKDLLQNVCAKFEKVIVIMNSANSMDMSFLKEYDIDATILCTSTGDAALTNVGKLLVGDMDFSGKTVDTYVYNNLTDTPASKNMGDYRFTKDGSIINYEYMNYGEDIYVGYRYFETRYFDQNNGVDSSYVYQDHIAYPFGHGLSYNEYKWSDFQLGAVDENGQIEVKLNVTNNGTISGKDVVEIYANVPYTAYDKENKIEKSAVKLVGFAKTDEIAPGATEEVTISVDRYELMSYDSTYAHDSTKGAYILDAGDYYLTAAKDAHMAVNNFLKYLNSDASVSGYRNFEGQYDVTLVKKAFTIDSLEPTSVSKDTIIKNNFEDATLEDANYLSRTNWSLADKDDLIYHDAISNAGVSEVDDKEGKVYTHNIADKLYAILSSTGWEASGNPNEEKDYSEIKTEQEANLQLTDLMGLDFDDPKWQELIESLSIADLNQLFSYGGYGTVAIEKIGKPKTKEYDGPARIFNMFTSQSSFVFPCEETIAQTWNPALAKEMAEEIGDLCILQGINGWYAPGMDTHRTAFGGRNFEYYSEDAYISGKMGAAAIEGIQSKGVYAYMKHFALNDQDTNRGTTNRVAVFAREQAIREIYLRPFEYSVKEGHSHGVMAAMNRVGPRQSIYHYGLLTEVLRKEWGFDGIVVTDYISGLSQEDMLAGLAAGLNLQLISQANPLSGENLSNGAKYKLQETAHYILYTQANSNAMNSYDYGHALYKVYLLVLGLVLGLFIAESGYLVIKYSFFKNPKNENGKWALAKYDTIIAISFGAVFVILLVLFIIYFFTTLLPAIKQAFTL